MVRDSLREIPLGPVDVTAPTQIDGLTYIDPADPAMPMYRVIANNRQPIALRDLIIAPVRSGYIGDGHQSDPSLVPPGGAEAVPDVSVEQVCPPVRDGVARCQLYRPTDAPEFTFPVPLDDAFDVYRWVVENGADIDADTSRIAVAGDSAGSNFAAALPLRAGADDVRLPDAVVMLGAFADFQADFQFERWPSFLALAPRGIVYDMAFAGFIRGAYGGATRWDHPWVSPIEGDLAGDPLTVVVAGTHDSIVAEALPELFGT